MSHKQDGDVIEYTCYNKNRWIIHEMQTAYVIILLNKTTILLLLVWHSLLNFTADLLWADCSLYSENVLFSGILLQN